MLSYIGYIAQIPFSFLSSISCSFIISLSLLYKKRLFNNYETRLVIILLIFYDGLSLSSLLPVLPYSEVVLDDNCSYNLEPTVKYNSFCTIQGVLIQFFSLSGIIWTGFINYINYRLIILKKDKISEKIPLIITIFIGIFTSTIPLIGVGYQESTSWCWFNIEKTKHQINHLKRFYWVGFFYIIAWAIIGFILYVSAKIWILFKKSNADVNRFNAIIYIPMILVFCFIPITISRIIGIIQLDGCDVFGFSVFSCCVIRLLGFLNSLVYGYHSDIRIVFIEVYGIESDYSQTIEIEKKIGMTKLQGNIKSLDCRE